MLRRGGRDAQELVEEDLHPAVLLVRAVEAGVDQLLLCEGGEASEAASVGAVGEELLAQRFGGSVGRLLLHEGEVHLLDAAVAPPARHVGKLAHVEAIAAAAPVALGQRAELREPPGDLIRVRARVRVRGLGLEG